MKIGQYLNEIWPSQCWVPDFKISILTISRLAFEKGRKVLEGINKRVVWETMLPFRVLTYISIEITCKNSGLNHKNWARFWYLKIFKILDFAHRDSKSHVTRSILKIQGSSFGHGFHGLIFPLSWQTCRGLSSQTSSWFSLK